MTYILKWNPDISSIALEEWERWIEHFPFAETNWSVWEHDNADFYDQFYMVKVGSGRTGIVAKGTFISMPREPQIQRGLPGASLQNQCPILQCGT